MEIINHKGKHYLKTETGYREVLATTDSSLIIESNMDIHEIPTQYVEEDTCLPKPSRAFVEKYLKEYNKGRQIINALVEYEKCFSFTNGKRWLLKVSKDNTITIKKVKDTL